MSISLDNISSVIDTASASAMTANRASSLQDSLKGMSSETTEDELLQKCKDFESYFVEQVLKEVKECMLDKDEEEDSSLSTLTDYHMDSTIELMADELVDQMGESFTQQLYEQMKRNYNID